MSESAVASEAHLETPTPVASETQELSLRDIINRAATGETAEQITGETPREEAPAITRDEHGRFTSTRAPEGGTEATELADKPTTTAQEPETPAITAPQAWSAPEKEVFASLPREAQDAILRREKDVERAFQERARPLKEYEAIQEVLAPHAAQYRTQGYTDLDAIRMWSTVAGELKRDPANAIRSLIQAHGLAPEQILGRTADPQQQIQPATSDVAMQRLERLERMLATQAEQAQQAEQQRIVSRIEAFAADPKNEHFEAVRKYMGALMTADPELTMEAAYERAVYANPEVRAKIMAKEAAAAEAKRMAEAKAKAEAARRAASPVRGAPPMGAGGSVATGERTIRQEIEAAIAASR